MAAKFIFNPRIIRSPRADCWGEELETAQSAYSDEYLAEVAREGFSAVWVHVQLRELLSSHLYPGSKKRNMNLLRKIIDRADNHGVQVYAYLLEPRAPRDTDPIWQKHSNIQGQPCTFAGIHPDFDGTY
ncbi:MAG: hypothetical protein AUJ92_10685 [Armatimonadetes bacterium CG2_30_59_28]|nr:hypothetical protein [Armatimonadota bacterium]OIO94145.1 MAG: hypothetical protein AUJ92_10685 [Armatimonadetes bacterium CG2_30_59_28]PIU64423.1 MAG: hypothetical protein COS85_12515 [Armatimonadetes bacterium CG07_land_8_20_14_0_80_59_28]